MIELPDNPQWSGDEPLILEGMDGGVHSPYNFGIPVTARRDEQTGMSVLLQDIGLIVAESPLDSGEVMAEDFGVPIDLVVVTE